MMKGPIGPPTRTAPQPLLPVVAAGDWSVEGSSVTVSDGTLVSLGAAVPVAAEVSLGGAVPTGADVVVGATLGTDETCDEWDVETCETCEVCETCPVPEPETWLECETWLSGSPDLPCALTASSGNATAWELPCLPSGAATAIPGEALNVTAVIATASGRTGPTLMQDNLTSA